MLVRFGQISATNETTQGSSQALANLISALGGLKLMDIQVHRDRGPCMTELPLFSAIERVGPLAGTPPTARDSKAFLARTRAHA